MALLSTYMCHATIQKISFTTSIQNSTALCSVRAETNMYGSDVYRGTEVGCRVQ